MTVAIAIRIDGVSVLFNRHRITHKSLKHALATLFDRTKAEDFRALREVSLSIEEGESVGLVGRNGAGKSTLLRVLSRVIQPQQGNVWVNTERRLVPLLELGIGFQPDLTGRENCYLAGSLLGLTRSEVSARLASIVAFSELADFIDQPVKTYSSGMFARLAFSLATDVEPDILLLDEVLGVGDQFFMRKCVARMQKLMASGITTILVSHNLDFLVTHCNRLIWLDHGQVVMDGAPSAVAAAYRKSA
jgi:lipopolysaccharide transport system ATP-binding protein